MVAGVESSESKKPVDCRTTLFLDSKHTNNVDEELLEYSNGMT